MDGDSDKGRVGTKMAIFVELKILGKFVIVGQTGAARRISSLMPPGREEDEFTFTYR